MSPASGSRSSLIPVTADGTSRGRARVQVGIGGTLALAGSGAQEVAWIGENAAWIALFFMCFYICAYAWSWGPLPWLYAAEVQFLETRSAGQSIATLVNLLFSFVIGQARPDSAVACW